MHPGQSSWSLQRWPCSLTHTASHQAIKEPPAILLPPCTGHDHRTSRAPANRRGGERPRARALRSSGAETGVCPTSRKSGPGWACGTHVRARLSHSVAPGGLPPQRGASPVPEHAANTPLGAAGQSLIRSQLPWNSTSRGGVQRPRCSVRGVWQRPRFPGTDFAKPRGRRTRFLSVLGEKLGGTRPRHPPSARTALGSRSWVQGLALSGGAGCTRVPQGSLVPRKPFRSRG